MLQPQSVRATEAPTTQPGRDAGGLLMSGHSAASPHPP